jgi:ribosome biogenesis GTPase A
MAIQWYPGHMAKARKALGETIPSQDVVIEVIDARLPASSANAVLTELRGGKPCVKVLAKADLADPIVTRAWLRYFEASAPHGSGKVVAIASSTERRSEHYGVKARLLQICERLADRPNAGVGGSRRTRVIVVGIPNAGKSTLINLLVGRRVAKVGDEPAVTKIAQQVVLDRGIVLSDNAGILWPKLDDDDASNRLALVGALPDTSMDFESVAHAAADLLGSRYPALLAARYKVTFPVTSPEALLEAIGRRRGCLASGGRVDLHKAADILIHDFRAGLLGRISLEGPPERSE